MSTSVSRGDVAVIPPARRADCRLWSPLRSAFGRSRAWIHRHPRLRAPYRVLIAVVGGIVVVIGLVLVPLPGPGWLIVFLGVAVLGTEFPAARRLTLAARRLARRARRWWRARRQRRAAPVRASGTAA